MRTPSKKFPCWCCGNLTSLRPRYRCNETWCRRQWLDAYGRGGRPDPDESSIYRQNIVEETLEVMRESRRDRIVRSYSEGIISYTGAKQALLELGASATGNGAERMIHRTLHTLGLEGQGNRGVAL